MKGINRLKILQDAIDRNLHPGQAAEMLGITPRHCRRLLKRYRQLGPLGMNNHSRGRVGNHLLPTSLIDQALCIIRVIHSVGQLIAATIGTTILVTGATSDGKLALLVPAELFKDAYRRMGLDTKNLSRTIEDAGTVIEPLLPWTSAGVYMATTLGVSTLDLLPWAIQCYAAIFFALIYGFSGIGIARTASASEKSPQSSVTE